MNTEHKNQDLFENAKISKAVWTLALPTMASMLVTVFYNLADTFFVGQTGDSMQVAAVSLAMPLFLVFMAMGNLFGIGGSSAISRFFGQKKMEDIKHVSSFCFYGAIVVSIIVGALAIIFRDAIIPYTGATEATYDYVYLYLTYLAIGAPFIVVSNAFGNIVRSVGFAKEAMVGMMIGTIVNIVLDPIMILSMDMGVVGAAIATVIGNVFASLYYVVLLTKKKSPLSISFKDFTLEKRIVTNVVKIGIPASLNNLLMCVANVVYNMALSGYGEAPIAAMGIALKTNMMMIMLYLGLTMGAQPLVGYNFGAKNFKRMKSVIRYVAVVALCIGLGIGAFFLVNASSIVTVFINDSEVIFYGTKMLRIQALSGCLLGIMFVAMSTLQSMGKAVASLILSICRQGLVFIPSVFILNTLFGLDGLVWAQSAADFASIILAVVLLVVTIKSVEKEVKAT